MKEQVRDLATQLLEANETHPMMCLLEGNYLQHDQRNEVAGYDFTSVQAVSKRVTEQLRAAGLFILSCEFDVMPEGDEPYAVVGKEVVNGREVTMYRMTVRCTIVLSDGEGNEYGPYQGLGSGIDYGDKAAMMAETSAFKYAISRPGLISWGGDPEASQRTDSALGGKGKTKKPRKSKQLSPPSDPAATPETQGPDPGPALTPPSAGPDPGPALTPPPATEPEPPATDPPAGKFSDAQHKVAMDKLEAAANEGTEALTTIWAGINQDLRHEINQRHPEWKAKIKAAGQAADERIAAEQAALDPAQA